MVYSGDVMKENGEILINTLNNFMKQFEPIGDEREGKDSSANRFGKRRDGSLNFSKHKSHRHR